MVVKLETVAALCADVYPVCKPRGRGDECAAAECPRRQKARRAALPALVESDSEPEAFEEQPRRFVPHQTLRRQNSISPQRREKMRRQLVLPSLSEDEEP